MDWFERLFGFAEESPGFVRENLDCQGEWLTGRVNGRRFRAGRLQHPTLAQLQAESNVGRAGRLRLGEVVADVRDLHRDAANAGAVFQVASQFNLLEMISPKVAPEQGITRYERDRTQGPACALACAAGTVFRNYFVEIEGRRGQREERQLDGLDRLAEEIGNHGQFWEMVNGYALATPEGLGEMARRVEAGEQARLRGLFKVGVQADTEVTLDGGGHCVTQLYCSAMPVAYSRLPAPDWEPFARLALEAAYEATLLAALRVGEPLYLTLLGGGAFGNPTEWILDAMERAFTMFADRDLDIRIVSHGRSNPALEGLLSRFG